MLTAALFIAGVPFIGLQNNYIALLQGILDIRGLAVQRSVAVLLATVVSVPVVWFFGFVGAAVQFLGLNLLVTLLLGWRCRSLGYAPLAVRLDGREVLLLASFGLMSMASGFAQGVSDTAVRTQLIDMAGAAANGLLQAPYALTMTVNSIVLASIGSIALATIAPKSDPGEISDAIDRLLSVVVPLGAAALGLLGLLGVPAIVILYSKAFTSGAAFLPYLLAADLLFVFVWVIGAPLLAAGDRLLWFSLELIQAAARWAIALLLLPHLGGLAVVIGFLAAVALHVALNLRGVPGTLRPAPRDEACLSAPRWPCVCSVPRVHGRPRRRLHPGHVSGPRALARLCRVPRSTNRDRRQPAATFPPGLKDVPTPPLVSVIVPSYNVERFLPDAVASVRRQMWKELELIIVDDGSTDGTAELAARFAAEDPRVRVVRKPNGGPSSARNAGIAAARGELVCFLDADDMLLPEKINRQVAFLEFFPGCDLVYSDYYVGDDILNPVFLKCKRPPAVPMREALRPLQLVRADVAASAFTPPRQDRRLR